MYIREIHIKNFGNLKNHHVQFSPGLNVIYGENGAGKSTMQQFLCAMLFGMEKSRGRAGRGNPYDRYEPWEAPAYYAGSMRFCTGGQDFYLERNFYHKERSAYLVNERDGEELSVEQGDLRMLLGGISKAAYENTFFIRQGDILPKGELADCLRDELHNLTKTGDGSFELSRTFDALGRERKALEKQCRQAEAEKNSQLELLGAQERMLKERREKLSARYEAQREQIAQLMSGAERMDQDLRSQSQWTKKEGMDWMQGQENEKPGDLQINDAAGRNRKKISAVFRILLYIALCAGWLLLCLYLRLPRNVWFIGQAAVLVLILSAVLRGKKKQDGGDTVLQGNRAETVLQRNRAEETDAVIEENAGFQAEMAKRRAVLSVLEEELQENELELRNNLDARSEVIQISEKNGVRSRELEAVALAEETLQSLAAEMEQSGASRLNKRVAEIFSQITGGQWGEVMLSEKYEPRIAEEYRVRSVEAFSVGTMQQAYFAFRMAAGQFLEQEETLPILMDEVFSMYDGRRLKEALTWIGRQKRQIFLFTCQEREMEYLKELGIPFQCVSLSE